MCVIVVPTLFPGRLARGSPMALRTGVGVARHLAHLDQPAVEAGHLLPASEQLSFSPSVAQPSPVQQTQSSPFFFEETVGDCHTVGWLVGQHLPLSSAQAVDTAGHGRYHDNG